MKRVIILATLLSAFYCSKAQPEFGVKAGVNSAKINFGNENYSTSSQMGFFAGVTGKYMVAPKIAIQADLLYSTEGTKEKAVGAPLSGNIKETFVNIPVLVQFVPVQNVFVGTGPQISLLLSTKERFGPNNSDPSYHDIKEYYKTLDLRWCFDAGYQLDQILEGLGVEIRYAFSLSKANNSTISGTSVKNQVLSLGAVYYFSGLGKKK